MTLRLIPLVFVCALSFGCGQERSATDQSVTENGPSPIMELTARNFEWTVDNDNESSSNFKVAIKQSGRYRIEIFGSNQNGYVSWLEDYVDNTDDRSYNITGDVIFDSNGYARKDGAPLAAGLHKMKLHSTGEGSIDSLKFSLMT